MVIRAYLWTHIFGRSTPGLMFFGILVQKLNGEFLKTAKRCGFLLPRHMDPVFVWIIRATLATVHFVMYLPL